MVSALLCILAFKAIGQDTTQIGAKTANSVKYCYLTITTNPPQIDSFVCPDLVFRAHPMPQDTIGMDTRFTKFNSTIKIIPARGGIGVLRDLAWSLDGSTYGIMESSPPPHYGNLGFVVPAGTNPVSRESLFKALWHSVKGYRPYGDRKVLNWSVCVFSGVAWGIHEAIYADGAVLEKRFGFSKYSWGGSEAWQSKYPGGRYYDGASPVLWKDKTNILREAKKTTAYLGRFPFYAVGISITMNKKRHWLDYLVASGLYTLSSFATYEFIR